jgi:hypothetical protein
MPLGVDAGVLASFGTSNDTCIRRYSSGSLIFGFRLLMESSHPAGKMKYH